MKNIAQKQWVRHKYSTQPVALCYILYQDHFLCYILHSTFGSALMNFLVRAGVYV